MKKSDVKIGMKVVPFKKTVLGYGDLDKSFRWKEAKKAGQKFLYVTGWDADGYWVLSNKKDSDPEYQGDFFRASDFRPYKPKADRQIRESR